LRNTVAESTFAPFTVHIKKFHSHTSNELTNKESSDEKGVGGLEEALIAC
jgi:hypothetical protein